MIIKIITISVEVIMALAMVLTPFWALASLLVQRGLPGSFGALMTYLALLAWCWIIVLFVKELSVDWPEEIRALIWRIKHRE